MKEAQLNAKLSQYADFQQKTNAHKKHMQQVPQDDSDEPRIESDDDEYGKQIAQMEGLDFFGGGQEGELIPSDEQSDDDDMPDLDDIPDKKEPQLTDAQKADKFNEFMKD